MAEVTGRSADYIEGNNPSNQSVLSLGVNPAPILYNTNCPADLKRKLQEIIANT